LKAGGVYLNTEVDKCELFALTLENAFTLNNSLDNSTEYLVQQKLSEPDILPQNILLYSSPNTILDIIRMIISIYPI